VYFVQCLKFQVFMIHCIRDKLSSVFVGFSMPAGSICDTVDVFKIIAEEDTVLKVAA
jgi:hypothetical protein